MWVKRHEHSTKEFLCEHKWDFPPKSRFSWIFDFIWKNMDVFKNSIFEGITQPIWLKLLWKVALMFYIKKQKEMWIQVILIRSRAEVKAFTSVKMWYFYHPANTICGEWSDWKTFFSLLATQYTSRTHANVHTICFCEKCFLWRMGAKNFFCDLGLFLRNRILKKCDVF